MKTVYILAGPPGAGKTWLRLGHPGLRGLPVIDMADIYQEFPELGWDETMEIALKRLRRALEERDSAVVEGLFRPKSRSFRFLLAEIVKLGAEPQLIRMSTSASVCERRIKRQLEANEITAAEAAIRLELLETTKRKEEKEK